MIELLDPIEWPKLEEIFSREWNAVLPNPLHANMLVELEDEELIGFCMTESLIRVGNFYITNKHRGNGTVKRLISRVQKSAQESSRSFVAFADQERYANLFRSLGMRPVGEAFRKDFF
jgi:predicted GNAT family N-acyltransferase